MKRSQEQQLKLAVTAVLIALLVVVTGLAFVYKKHQTELLQKDLKISVLISEIGEVKEQNEKLYRYFAEEKESIHAAVSQLGTLQKTVTGVGIDSAKQQMIQKDLASANTNLLQLVQKKDEAIRALQQKNSKMAQNLSGDGKMPGYLNILILGENMQLTDTIMLASINKVDKKVTFISIPRDLFYNGRKLNEYYEKFGVSEMKQAISEITGIMPDKYVVVDMNSFVGVVNAMGGIDVDVKKSIVDASYPGPNYTYTKVSFQKGYQHMDGQRALKYARSRKSTTDFDRSDRQQEILVALKQKAEELNLKEDVAKLTEIYDSVKDRIKTDITFLDVLNYYNECRTYPIGKGNVISNQNFLYSTKNSAGQYILLPLKGSYTALQNYIKKTIGA